MAATLTIGTTTYPSIAIIEDQYDQTDNLQERGRNQFDIIDYVGVHFVRGEQITVTDPVLGTVFRGFVNTDKERSLYPSGYIYHTIDAIGMHYLADKRTYTATYTTSSLAGKIIIDILSQTLIIEGIVQNFAEHSDSTAAEFNTGNLNNASGITDPSTGNDYLELATFPSTTIIENTTTTFSTGTLSNCTAANNVLSPTPVSGLKIIVSLPIASSTAFVQMAIWSGSVVLGGGDFFNYSIFISSTSPAYNATMSLIFSDGTTISGSVDQNNYSDYSGTDLSAVAKDTWYARRISLSAYSGKTITTCSVSIRGANAGTYTIYYQNSHLDSGTVFFATNAFTTQVNPIIAQYIVGYAPASLIVSVIPVINTSVSVRTSPLYSIDATKIIGSSNISWLSGGSAGGSVAIQLSYDNGVTFSLCTNNAPLPNMPASSIVAGQSIVLKEYFVIGSDPEIIPTLESVIINIYSSPKAVVGKTDYSVQYATQAEWNTGTYGGLTSTVSGDLTMGTTTSPWPNNSTANQQFLFAPGSSTTITDSISSHVYNVNVKVTSTIDQVGICRLDWAGTISTLNGISIEFDVTVPTTNNFSSQMQIYYLQTYWYDSGYQPWYGAYIFNFQQSGVSNNCYILKGNNAIGGSGGTSLASATVASNPTHVKITVDSSGNHNVYLNGSGTPTLTASDTTFTSGQIGVGGYTFHQSSGSGQTADFKFSNAVITPNTTTNGTWISANFAYPASLIQDSIIYWTQVNVVSGTTAAYVQTSVDGGATFQTCTNGGSIPNLPSGTDLTGKSIQVYIWLVNTPGNLPLPLIRQLFFSVLGQWPGAIGIRDTAPLGNDMSITRTVGSGWGNAFDTQAWVQSGTGTTQVSSNTETISNTTGDVNMRLGTRTWTDQDCTIRFKLSAATIDAGITLRYVSATSFYRLFATTTALTIIKNDGGSILTMNTVPIALSTNTLYRMRFRIVGSGPISLFGNVWLDGTLEPTINSSNGLQNNNWTIISGE